MLGHFLEQIRIEYLVIDEEFRIVEMSSGVANYADDIQHVAIKQDVRIAFPEFIGLESQISDIAQCNSHAFELKGICRRSDYQNPLYVDLYITSYQMVKDFWLYASDQEDTANNVPVSVILFKDATERMVLEQRLGQIAKETMLLANALDDYQKYLSSLLAYMSDALLVCDRFGKIKMVNQSLHNLFGYSQSEIFDQPIDKMIPNPNLHPQNYTGYSYSTELFQNVAVTCQTKNSRPISLSISASVIFYDKREFPHYIYLARYNTLDDYQKYLSSLLAYMSDALLVCDRFGKIKMVNQSLHNLFGYSQSEILNQPIDKMIPNPNLHPQNYTGYSHSTELFQNAAVTCQTKSGQSISLSISASVVFYERREFPHYIYLARPMSKSPT